MRQETRRAVLSTVGAVGLLGLAGCSGNGGGPGVETETPTPTSGATPEPEPTPTEGGGMEMSPEEAVHTWLREREVGGATDTYDGTIDDLTGRDTVTILVGAPGNGGAFAFSPTAARVTQGAELAFEWTGEGGAHNVESLPEEQLGLSDYEFSSGDPMQAEGVQYTRTMDVAGVLLTHCEPHLSLGMKGGIVVESAEQVSPEDAVDRWLTETEVGGADDTYDGTIEDLTGQDTVTVQVGATGNGGAFAFSPVAARVSYGTELQFEWTGESGAHNVESLPEEQLGLSDYTFSSGEPVQAEGVQYTQTMNVAGVLLTHCEPHLSLGMKGGIVVEPPEPVPPEEAIDRWLTETEVGAAESTYDGTIEDMTGQDEVTILVGAPGNGASFAFAPSAVRVSVGTELRFEWTGRGFEHNVRALPDRQIGLSDYEFSSGPAIRAEGVHFLLTVDIPGVVLYHCDPHLGQGMKGGIVVE